MLDLIPQNRLPRYLSLQGQVYLARLICSQEQGRYPLKPLLKYLALPRNPEYYERFLESSLDSTPSYPQTRTTYKDQAVIDETLLLHDPYQLHFKLSPPQSHPIEILFHHLEYLYIP